MTTRYANMDPADVAAMKAAREENRKLSTVDLLDRIAREFPEIHGKAKVVGKWVWVTFDARPDEGHLDYLKDLGFRWSKRRRSWMHPCGCFSKGRAPYDPRQKYGEVDPNEYRA